MKRESPGGCSNTTGELKENLAGIADQREAIEDQLTRLVSMRDTLIDGGA